MKTCTKCLVPKELEEFSKKKDGKSPICKKCAIEYQIAYRKLNKEKAAKRDKKYRLANKDKITKYQKMYLEANKEKLIKKRKNYYEANKESICKEKRDYYEENKKKLLSRNRKYYEDNKDKISLHRESPSTYIGYVNRIPVSDKPLFDGGFVTVECKKCGSRFSPSVSSIKNREKSFNTGAGESNFYCSDLCKGSCFLFNFNTDKSIDPLSKLFIPKSKTKKARNCQTGHLKQLQCDEVGHNYCEKCGDIIDVELHHTQPVGSKDSISSAGHLLICAGCHVKLEQVCA